MFNVIELKRGSTFVQGGTPFYVMTVSVQTPSARGANTMVKAKLRNLLSGAVISKTFRACEKVEEADLETQDAQLLYRTGDTFYFMDLVSYEQFEMSEEEVGDAIGYLLDEAVIRAQRFEGRVIGLELPNTVNLEVEYTEPFARGDSVNAQTKPATLVTGLVVQVPPHVKIGDVLKVDTRTGKYIERV